MERISAALTGVGVLAFSCGIAGLDGRTPVGCVVVASVGFVTALAGGLLRKMDKVTKRAKAKALSEQEQRKDEFLKVWEACQISE